ncbi:hypothetical protein ASL20_14885 [Cupriavidus necator]|nr:hypothetical protein ASL20_14885 [Cupriavidus necator]
MRRAAFRKPASQPTSAPYDPFKDFAYLTVAVQAPNVLSVPANSRFKTIQDNIVSYEKANP